MSTAKIIDGKGFAALLRARVAEKVRDLRDFHRIQAGLAVVLVGADPASQIYVKNKIKYAEDLGMKSFAHFPDPDITQEELMLIVEGLNNDPNVNGILVQLPLPEKFDEEEILLAIDPAKDVDGFHPYNAGMLAIGGDGMIPCTPYGCLLMLKDHFGEGGMSGKHAVVVGRSNIVGKPMGQLLLQENCTVVMTHSRTANLAEECRRADIIVAAVGRPHLIQGDWIKPGAVVIDVGMNRIGTSESGKAKLAGDVDFDAAVKVASAITPVPGGVGPMTIAVLLRNTLVAALRQNHITDIDISDL